MPQRICSLADCEKPHVAKGYCKRHYNAWREAETGRSHHTMYVRTCATCGAEWRTPRPEARYCTAKCKGVHLRQLNQRKCKLPFDHPVMVAIREARASVRKPRPKPNPPRAAECEWCAASFITTKTTQRMCSTDCKVRYKRARRRGRQAGSTSHYTWAEVMRIFLRFDRCCAYCLQPVDGQPDPDHVVPLSKGGSNSATNILPACRPCNSDKRDLLLHEWVADRAYRGLSQLPFDLSDARYVHLTDARLISPAA